jgi:hypothetical protein
MTNFISRVLSIMSRHHHHVFTSDHAEPIYHLVSCGNGLEKKVCGYRLYCECGTGREFYAVKR